MLFKIALVLLVVWLLGVLGVYDVDERVHVLFLIAFWCVLLGFVRARDAARRPTGAPSDRP